MLQVTLAHISQSNENELISLNVETNSGIGHPLRPTQVTNKDKYKLTSSQTIPIQ